MNAEDIQEDWKQAQWRVTAEERQPFIGVRTVLHVASYIVLPVALMYLAGCANGDRIESSNPSSVVIFRNDSVASASALANKECARYGKNARLATMQGFIMSFDCVGP